MRTVDLEAIREVAEQLDKLGKPYALTGGVVVGFLLEHPELVDLRPTNDVDAIAAVTSYAMHAQMEARLRNLGFAHDVSPGAPTCRFIFNGIKVDVMPARDQTGRFSDRWFEYSVNTARLHTLRGVTVRTVRAPCFLAMKLTAFADRGSGDWYGSHDLEDIITVVDGRASLADEVAGEAADLRKFVCGRILEMLGTGAFLDALPGHLPHDMASQNRLPFLLQRMQSIAAMDG